MALMVGELTGFISLDTRGFDTGMDRAERGMRDLRTDVTRESEAAGDAVADGLADGVTRAERQMAELRTALASDAGRAGDAAGEALRNGLADGAAEGVDRAGDEVSGLRREVVREAEQAGDQGGDALADGLGEGGEQGAQDAAAGVEAGQGRMAAAGAVVGAAAGAALIAAFVEAMDHSRIAGRLGAQLGATPEEARRYGDLAGDLYADAITEDFQGAADAISVTMRSGLLPPDATNKQIESIATKVSDLASTFEMDLGQTANAVGQTLKTGLAKDATEALDAITRGMQQMGPRADDMADSFNEYSTQFRQAGLNVADVVGMMKQGLDEGARDTDIVADGIKEFVLIVQGGGEEVNDAFEKIGLNGEKMQRVFSEGGPKARDALGEVFDRIRKVKDPADRSALALELFGTKSEDMQKALQGLDLSTARDELGKTAGAADEMGKTLRDNAGTRVEQLKRQLSHGFVEAVGGAVIGLEDLGGRLRGFWDEAGKGADNLPDQVLNALQILVDKGWEKVRELGPKLIDAVVEAGQEFANYVMENPEEVLKIAALGAAFVAAIAALPIVVGAALVAAATAMIWTFVGGMISAFVEKVPEWWNSFTDWISEKADQAGLVFDVLGAAIGDWFGGLWDEYIGGPVSRTWREWMATVNALPGRTTAALADLGSRLYRSASGAWQDFQNAAVRKGTSIVWWARRLPGRIVGAIGGVGSLLYGKGQSIVSGLWAGIRSMGGWLRNTLYAWARSVIPGPIAKALGIASPSKVMRDQIGRWIPAGVVDGIRDGQGAVDEAMASLVNPDRVRVAGGRLMDLRAGAAGGAGGDGRPLVLRVEIGGRAFGELVVDTALHEVRVNPGVKSELRAQLVGG
ncbi:phage tail tape measure protein [Streptomyces nanhaiensis]|uniref:phage tail tape measure protein n=1 Tax=Streptomyces nanhaiensis TaxID=679319 RepID=UPI00399D5440